jgi:hypothetical protein
MKYTVIATQTISVSTIVDTQPCDEKLIEEMAGVQIELGNYRIDHSIGQPLIIEVKHGLKANSHVSQLFAVTGKLILIPLSIIDNKVIEGDRWIKTSISCPSTEHMKRWHRIHFKNMRMTGGGIPDKSGVFLLREEAVSHIRRELHKLIADRKAEIKCMVDKLAITKLASGV